MTKNIVANWTPIDKTRDLDMPAGLDEKGQQAYRIIVEYLKAHELTDTGGCKAFYAPADWRVRGEQYGHKSVLVVVYDGGDLRPVFSMDAAYDFDCMTVAEHGGRPANYKPYSLYESLQDKLGEVGLHFEECTSWYCAVYVS